MPKSKVAVKNTRGPQKAPTKKGTYIRFSPEVLAFFDSDTKGYQTRIDNFLKEHIQKKS